MRIFKKNKNKGIDPLLIVSNRLSNAEIHIIILEKENRKLRSLLVREAAKLGYDNLEKIQDEIERIERIENKIIEWKKMES